MKRILRDDLASWDAGRLTLTDLEQRYGRATTEPITGLHRRLDDLASSPSPAPEPDWPGLALRLGPVRLPLRQRIAMTMRRPLAAGLATVMVGASAAGATGLIPVRETVAAAWNAITGDEPKEPPARAAAEEPSSPEPGRPHARALVPLRDGWPDHREDSGGKLKGSHDEDPARWERPDRSGDINDEPEDKPGSSSEKPAHGSQGPGSGNASPDDDNGPDGGGEDNEGEDDTEDQDGSGDLDDGDNDGGSGDDAPEGEDRDGDDAGESETDGGSGDDGAESALEGPTED